MHIDMRTALFMVAISESLYGLLLGAVWALRRRETSLAFWSAASLCTAAGGFLYCLRGAIPDLLSIAAGNMLMLFTGTLRWAGLRHFDGLPAPRWQYLSLPLILFLLSAFSKPLGLTPDHRTIIVCSCGVSYAILMVLDTLRANRVERLSTRPVFIVASVVSIVLEFLQIATALQDHSSANGNFMAWQGWYPLSMLVFFSTYALLNLGGFMMLFERHEDRLVLAATLDALTSLLNRAGFNQLAERQCRRSARDGQPVSVLVMDLDWFKQINDTYGHDAGDAVLCAFARCARAALRPTDLLSRPGGEEFWALLPVADLDEAVRIAQRVCDQFRELRVLVEGQAISATVSIGVAEVDTLTHSLQATIVRADQALYAAKHEGRDRVHCMELAPASPNN
jgi:diguanylate cyclase (GGDEF)-like protein